MNTEAGTHKLLARQIKKYLLPGYESNPEIMAFLSAVDASYRAFDRDREITTHAFSVSEQEYQSLYENLLAENQLKKLSIEKLKETVAKLDLNSESAFDLSDDLLSIADYLKNEIQKRAEAERELNDTLFLLTNLVSKFHTGILIKDENKRVLFINQEFCKVFNIQQAPEELQGKDFSDFAEQYKSCFENPEEFAASSRHLDDHPLELYNDQVKTTDGRVYQRHFIPIIIHSQNKGHLWEYRDITIQVKAQEAISRGEQRYRNIVEKSSDIIYKTDISGKFTYVNPVATRITGFSKEELLEMRYTDLVRGDMREDVVAFYLDQLKERKMSTYYEFPITTKTGDEKWIGQSVQLSEASNGNLEFTSLAIDITQRVNYQRTLNLQNEKYLNIITNMNLGLIEVDIHDQIRYANPGFTVISGYSVEELIGRKAGDLFMRGNKELLKKKMEQRLRGESDSYEVQVFNKHGEVRWWMVSGAPNYDETGKLIGSIGIHLDITEQKKLEKELEVQKEKAEASARAQATFLANTSHEIRTPLNGIIGMIRELSFQDLPDKQRKYVHNASIASQHLLSVLNNVLDISKIEAGELNLDQHHFRMKDLIKDIKAIMLVKAREKGILLSIDTHELNDLVYIGDAARIRQIMINLVGNSIKFTASGGVFVDCLVDKSNPALHEITFVVEDTGIGMDEDYKKQLFKKFSQEDSSVSRKYGGTGLGMAITYELIQLMQGRIDVSSSKGDGTRIAIHLSLCPGDLRKVDPADLGPVTEMDARVLLVEDNEFNRAVARNTLERFGCMVDEAENGQIALHLLNSHTYNIILMDLQMPVMDGFETTRLIRNDMGLTIPIIALTANAFKSELEQCLSVGMNDYVTKPYDEEKLMAAIFRLLHTDEQIDDVQEEIPRTQVLTKTVGDKKLYDLSILKGQGIDNPDYLRKMIKIFSDQSSQVVRDLNTAYAQKDLGKVYQLAHKIKPSIDGMGIHSLKDLVRAVEQKAHQYQDSKDLGEQVQVLCSTLNRVIEQLKDEEV